MIAGKPCVYCGKPAKTRDHLIPKMLGGLSLGVNNIVPACVACNQFKGSMTPAGMRGVAEDFRALAQRFDSMAATAEQLMAQRNLSFPKGREVSLTSAPERQCD